MKIIAIPTTDGKDCVYVTREGIERLEHSDDLMCSHVLCDHIPCVNCQLADRISFVRLDDLEHYVYNCKTNAEAENGYKEEN